MMGITDLALVFQSVVCLTALAFVFLRFWAEARLDSFRQEMFIIRDELFDYAADGHIGFDDPAYRLLRRSMNGFIRYAHQLTFFRVCMTAIELKVVGQASEVNWSEQWERAIKKIQDEKVRCTLETFHNRAMRSAAKRLIFGSPVLLLLIVCSLPIIAVQTGWQNLSNVRLVLRKASIITVWHVIDTRMIENQAAAAAAA